MSLAEPTGTTSSASFTSSALRRLVQGAERQACATREHCEFCSEPLPEGHRHLIETASRTLVCACRACSLLFDREAASEGRYRLVPDRVLSLPDFHITDAQWESLRLPVGLAFFFYSTAAGRVLAFFPSPMGPTEAHLDGNAWNELETSNPALQQMERDVEALLIRRTGSTRQYLIVPLGECYRLVGLLRMHWKGLSGGPDVWREIAGFFGALQERAHPVRRGAPDCHPAAGG
jgi:hypothetical protein